MMMKALKELEMMRVACCSSKYQYSPVSNNGRAYQAHEPYGSVCWLIHNVWRLTTACMANVLSVMHKYV